MLQFQCSNKGATSWPPVPRHIYNNTDTQLFLMDWKQNLKHDLDTADILDTSYIWSPVELLLRVVTALIVAPFSSPRPLHTRGAGHHKLVANEPVCSTSILPSYN